MRVWDKSIVCGIERFVFVFSSSSSRCCCLFTSFVFFSSIFVPLGFVFFLFLPIDFKFSLFVFFFSLMLMLEKGEECKTNFIKLVKCYTDNHRFLSLSLSLSHIASRQTVDGSFLTERHLFIPLLDYFVCVFFNILPLSFSFFTFETSNGCKKRNERNRRERKKRNGTEQSTKIS